MIIFIKANFLSTASWLLIISKQYNQTSIVILKKHIPSNVYESGILLYAYN